MFISSYQTIELQLPIHVRKKNLTLSSPFWRRSLVDWNMRWVFDSVICCVTIKKIKCFRYTQVIKYFKIYDSSKIDEVKWWMNEFFLYALFVCQKSHLLCLYVVWDLSCLKITILGLEHYNQMINFLCKKIFL